ncbi:pyridine nucleotide-disulfide oxidoreductase [Leptospira inadai serovar Lyme str. 10]|uniref:Pyridine nucleotide-disulfide oxidoreductase n=2 Tax=Leptospira inadai serovar Lyme TaxID=293084 RepID=V6HZ62_9LEPT|nr:NAD(P)-binding domain-containing protein [Leptospira inadai]EQA38319.1 pyridine nucleotide-disulfide oxidoreductase [Leptospira inadai serovar Lyme str. 10]PNV74405.1 pyridine nucleotide-disulfide oxidoreductase [Leptospira inadai serovar Lyme]
MKLLLPFSSEYFDWLRNDAPRGPVETYPLLGDEFRSSIPGIHIIGDLTGIPLLKYAADSGAKVVSFLESSPDSKSERVYDLLIVGGGPSGISAGIEAKKKGLKFLILEGNKAFHTIHSYPKGKPIFAEPEAFVSASALRIDNGYKETLIRDLQTALDDYDLPILEGKQVVKIVPSRIEGSRFEVSTESGETFLCFNVVLAIGKSGDSRRLGIPGEDGENVFHRLIDPADFAGQDIVVVGGGDSAIEAALALEETAKSVSLSYRGEELVRPKEENKTEFLSKVSEGKINFLPSSSVKEIQNKNVIFLHKNSQTNVPADSTLILIGSEPPISFLRKIGLAIQNVRSFREWFGFFAMISFSFLVYFGKAAFYGIEWYSWAACAGLIGFIFFSAAWFGSGDKKAISFKWNWNLFRTTYLSFAAVYFILAYVGSKYFGWFLLNKYPGFHYTLLYSLTIAVFGIRRMKVRPTKYIKRQTWTLILVQVFPLFLLPEIILPRLGELGLLGSSDGFLLTQVFPGGAYWKAYGLILAWPLNMGVLYDGGITSFWLIYGLVLSFGIIPYLVFRFGKGAYCGWICSCGGLAETLGDETRTKMPHGKWAYRLEHSGQWVLLAAILLTTAKLLGSFISPLWFLSLGADSVKRMYDSVVDIGLAGVLGLGAYFFLSGRIWCRMFCPLAGLMHIYARFSRFRIFSEKKRCISCNICTKVCHQGIDVMSYANRGRPMDSVQCVRCSACVVNCPTNVLSFGEEINGFSVFGKLKATL